MANFLSRGTDQQHLGAIVNEEGHGSVIKLNGRSNTNVYSTRVILFINIQYSALCSHFDRLQFIY